MFQNLLQPIVDVLLVVLQYLYNFSGNYGLAIILLTIIVRGVTFPLTHKQIKSAKVMQEIQPEIKKLQEKYKNDKEKLNEETMKLWKEYNVNPVAGCLPLLIQFPVLIAMFQLLRERDILFQEIADFSPYFLGMDMTMPDPTYILPVLAGATTYLQQKTMTTDQSQKALLIGMPIMLLVISINFQSGLVLYLVVSNLLSLGQHLLMNKPDLKGALKGNENS